MGTLSLLAEETDTELRGGAQQEATPPSPDTHGLLGLPVHPHPTNQPETTQTPSSQWEGGSWVCQGKGHWAGVGMGVGAWELPRASRLVHRNQRASEPHLRLQIFGAHPEGSEAGSRKPMGQEEESPGAAVPLGAGREGNQAPEPACRGRAGARPLLGWRPPQRDTRLRAEALNAWTSRESLRMPGQQGGALGASTPEPGPPRPLRTDRRGPGGRAVAQGRSLPRANPSPRRAPRTIPPGPRNC